MDETIPIYSLKHDKIIATHQVEGSEKIRSRVIDVLIINSDGLNKREPYIIRHAKKHRGF